MTRRELSRWLGLALAGPAWTHAASPGAAGEAEIKAAMTFNFTKFIDWPAGRAEGPLVIGVAGDDAVREALVELTKGREGGTRPVDVRRIGQPAEGEACHLLYVGRGVRKRAAEFAASRKGVVTTGDLEGFTKAGGIIGFLVVDNKLRFEVNLAAANQAGITISSRLLRLALEVKP